MPKARAWAILDEQKEGLPIVNEAEFTPMPLQIEKHLSYNILYIIFYRNYSIYKFTHLW